MPDLLERLKSALADRYAVESEIGRGGMATVFLAEDLKHSRQVAIKVLHPELAASLGTDRFLREISIVAGLDHPHILPLHDSGEADGLLYYVMPYVEGESLGERLEREAQLTVDEALSIAGEVADGLAYAHRQGVVHRDIKPGNILLAEGHARIADFGVARAVGVASAGGATATGLAVGTPKYMSPEQAAGVEVDGRSDVYALGCVLYETLAGDPPFDGPTPQVILTRKATETVPGLRVRRKTVPADMEAVIARAMATAPVDRFETAEDFAAALKAPEKVGRARRIRRIARPALNTAVTIALLAMGVWLALFFAGGSAGESDTSLDPNAIAVLPFEYQGTSEDLTSLARSIPAEFWESVTGEFELISADHNAVRELWTETGGTVTEQVPQARALEIAQAVGAGGVIMGAVNGTEEELTLAATLLEVPTGRIRVRRKTVEGSYGERLALVNMLLNELLTDDQSSWAVGDLPAIRRHKPEAVQAYAQGNFYRALALDSSFIGAATLAYEGEERDHAVASYAWEHQDSLLPYDRVYLLALAGWRFGATRTLAERLAQFDSVTKIPGAQEWLSGFPVHLYRWGSLVDYASYRDRAKAGLLRRVAGGHRHPFYFARLFGIAAAEGDTVAMVQYADEMAALAASAGDSAIAAVALLRIALMQGDREEAERLWDEIARGSDNFDTDDLLVLLVDGMGLDGLDRFLSPGEGMELRVPRTGFFWARARGRYPEWSASRDYWYDRWRFSGRLFRVRDALFLGEPEDSDVLAAASWIDSVATGAIVLDSPANDPEPETRIPALARCWSTLWKVSHGEIAGATEAIQYLREDVPLPYRYSVCAGIIEVLVTEQEGEGLPSAVAQLDSIVRPVPMELGSWVLTRDGTHWIDDLFLSQKLLQVGDTGRALEASRRTKPWNSFLPWATAGIFVDLLREEARLTAMVGDTAAAIKAYEHWLTLRDTRPDSPHWGAQWDSVRVEYAVLTGVEGH